MSCSMECLDWMEECYTAEVGVARENKEYKSNYCNLVTNLSTLSEDWIKSEIHYQDDTGEMAPGSFTEWLYHDNNQQIDDWVACCHDDYPSSLFGIPRDEISLNKVYRQENVEEYGTGCFNAVSH